MWPQRIGNEEFFEPLTFMETGKAAAAVDQNFYPYLANKKNVSHPE